jgi:hypothetical protein
MHSLTRGRKRYSALVHFALALALFVAGAPPLGVCVAQTNSGPLVGRVQDRQNNGLEDVRIEIVNVVGGKSGGR